MTFSLYVRVQCKKGDRTGCPREGKECPDSAIPSFMTAGNVASCNVRMLQSSECKGEPYRVRHRKENMDYLHTASEASVILSLAFRVLECPGVYSSKARFAFKVLRVFEQSERV